jgi:hypothetical protein
MRLVYEVQRSDLESLMHYHYEHAAATASLRALTQIVLPGVVAAAFSVLGIVQGAWILPVMGILLGLLLRAVLPRIMRWSIRASVARSLAQGTGASTLGRHELELSDDGLVDHAADLEYLHPWDELVDVVTLPDRAYIYLGPRQAYVIPQRGVREGDYQGFVRQLQKRLAAPSEEAGT